MKKSYSTALAIIISLGVFQGGPSDLDAQEGAVDLKGLILKKFDTNLDGNLTGLEKDGAVTFLQAIDRNGDSQISAAEQAAAIQSLNQMPDPKAKPKPAPRPPAPSTTMKRNTTIGIPKKPMNPGEIREGVKPDIKIIGRPTASGIDKKRAELEAIQQQKEARMRYDQEKKRAEAKLAAKVAAKKRSYYDGATIIEMSGDGVHTVVPRGAVIFIPPDLAGMIAKEPKGKLVRWPDFYKKYTKWINTRKVSWETAKGEDPIKEEERKAFAEGNKLIVAVFGKNPISVLEPPAEEEDTAVTGALGSDTKEKKK